MTTLRASSGRARRRGFTLLELLLAVALLATAVAVVVPSLTNARRSHRVQAAATKLLSRLSGIRVLTLTHSVPYDFLYEPDGRRYLILPAPGPESPDDPVASDATRRPDGTDPAAPAPLFHGELPEGVRFVPTSSARGGNADVSAHELPAAFRGARWSPPIRFRPDGGASDASVIISDADDRRIRFDVRGLTGTVRLRSDPPGGTR